MKDIISGLVEAKRGYYCDISDKIWDYAELSYQEFRSSRLLMDALRENGFTVTENAAGIPTAFTAAYGSGRPVIGFAGEYDALPLLSQQAGVAVPAPVEEGGSGHGCGHNALGASCLAAAVALKEYMERTGAQGTVVYYGTPAEERGTGKSFMARAGVFDDADVMITSHPAGRSSIQSGPTLASLGGMFSFHGVAAHAAAAPEHGRSALDAAELMVMGVQFLREHVIQEARIHHAYQDAGSRAANIVPAYARIMFRARAPRAADAKAIYERIRKCALGAAMMTETTVDIEDIGGVLDVIPNPTLSRLAAEAWRELGACPFSEEAYAVAAKFAPGPGRRDMDDLLDTGIPGYVPTEKADPGSTDLGDLSYRVPTVMVNFASVAMGTPGHTWQMTAQGRTAVTHDGLIHAAKVMALTGAKVLAEPALAETARAELIERTGGEPVILIPENARPEY